MRLPRQRLAVFVACVLATACGGDDHRSSASASRYATRVLVSDGAVPADHVDANLKNPWGIVFNPMGPVWVANNGTQTSTLYDGTGSGAPTPLTPLVVNLPNGKRGDPNPTGIVYNATMDFPVTVGVLPLPSNFIFDGEGGTLMAWAIGNLTDAVTVYDDGDGGAVYKGLAMARSGGANFLYAADFHNGKIDVFDGSFAKVTSPGGFTDPALPAGYAPFGIQNIQGKLYVTYALQAEGALDEVDGPGLGIVDLYDADGSFVKRVASAGALDAPWGLALAPDDFGSFSNALLVGNFGDGEINGYALDTGAYLGNLLQADGQPIRFPGLWGIAFGPGVSSQPTNTLFFAAGINDEADGVYGRIDLVTNGG